jgi:predicted Zn-dependent protease
MALSIEEETVLGQKFLAEIKKHYEVLDNDYANAFINDLGQYLTGALKTKPFPFHFYIIKDSSLNAFSAPGGLIFFYSGLIDTMDNCDMLAAVMAHEIGHSAARHLSHRVEQNTKIGLATMAGILAGVLIGGGAAASALITGSMAAGIQAQLHYSREDERQADQLGFRYSTECGFSPQGLIEALKKIEQGSWMGSGKTPPYLLTHPTGPERMANIDSMVKQYSAVPVKKEADHFRTLFPIFKTVVRAVSIDPDEAEREFLEDLKHAPTSPMAHLGLGMVYEAQSEYGEAISQLKKALEQRPDSVLILRTLGKNYQLAGKDREAIRILKKALTLKNEDTTSLFTLALSYENLESYQKAIALLKRLASLEPSRNEIYYHLGISYGRQNRLALAHYNFGLYFKALGELQKARFHFQKAKELAQNDSGLLEKIRKATKPKRQKAL